MKRTATLLLLASAATALAQGTTFLFTIPREPYVQPGQEEHDGNDAGSL